MSKHVGGFNDREEIYGGKESRKKKKKFREDGRVRDFKRSYSQDTDREDMNFKNKYR